MKHSDKKQLNKTVGVLKRKFKMGRADYEPGTLINKSQASKAPKMAKTLPKNPVKRTAIRGAV